MTKTERFVDNCKPQTDEFVQTNITEMSDSLDELLEPTPRQRAFSYHQALDMIKQFTLLIKDCNYQISPEN
jgi:hypothetical protein